MADYTADQYREAARKAMAAGDMTSARALIEKGMAAEQAPKPQTSIMEQAGSGVNEGMGGMMGLPVDAATALVNGLGPRPPLQSNVQRGPSGELSLSIGGLPEQKPLVDAPIGGSGTFRDMLSPFISDVAPQTTGQRYARRIGQEAGATVIPGSVAMRGAAAPLLLAGTELASAVGAGMAGQTSREIAPNNATADFIASLIGGMGPVVAGNAMRAGPTAPSIDDVRRQQGAAYDAVDASQARLDPTQRQGLIDQMRGRTDAMDMDEFLHPRANRTMTRMDNLDPSPRIADIEQKRRLIGRDVAGSLDPSESMIGQGMKDEIDDYLKSLADNGGIGPDAQSTLARLQEGRALTQRVKKAETISGAVTKAERRAATSGTGGNEVNTTRQNIRAILDNPKKSRGFSAPEREQMEAIVRGTPGVNALRLAGRMSPTAGALPLMSGIGATSVGGAIGGPVGAALGIGPMAIGSLAKGLAENLTKGQIDELVGMILNGAPVPKKGVNQTDVRAAIAAMLSQGVEPTEN
jgi:hypothetical protein